jgi:lipopolysaccharide/colanic/teichoic acid biosynthesis glycosyltransferase
MLPFRRRPPNCAESWERAERTCRSAVESDCYPAQKRITEYVLALVLAILTLPLLALGIVLVKLTSRGPAFYSQVRIGCHGRLFWIYKLRTMFEACETLTGPCWSLPHDTRITPIGRFLRATHVDELPQLWNVLRGEMALVGPRPERPEIVVGLERALPHYRERLSVLPGISGLAQIQLPADTDLASVRRKLAHDLYYIRHMSRWLDVRIYVCTFWYLVNGPCTRAAHGLLVPEGRKVEA